MTVVFAILPFPCPCFGFRHLDCTRLNRLNIALLRRRGDQISCFSAISYNVDGMGIVQNWLVGAESRRFYGNKLTNVTTIPCTSFAHAAFLFHGCHHGALPQPRFKFPNPWAEVEICVLGTQRVVVGEHCQTVSVATCVMLLVEDQRLLPLVQSRILAMKPRLVAFFDWSSILGPSHVT